MFNPAVLIQILRTPYQKKHAPSEDTRHKVARYFSNVLGKPLNMMLMLLPEVMPRWGKVRIVDGDSIKAAAIPVRGEISERDNLYVRFDTKVKVVTDSILDSRFSTLLCGGWAVEQRRCAYPKPSTSVFRAGESSLMEAINYLLLLHERSSTVSPRQPLNSYLFNSYHAPSVTVLVLLPVPPSTHFPCTPAVTKISFALAPSASSVLALSINSRPVRLTPPRASHLVHHRSELPVRRASSSLTRLSSKLRERPQNNVLAVANIIPANDNIAVTARPCMRASFLPLLLSSLSPLPIPLVPSSSCGWLHYILTFVNINNIRRLRYQFRLIHPCRAELRPCVCDRYGGEWNRDRRGRECDGYGRTCEWDGGLERGVGVCVTRPPLLTLAPRCAPDTRYAAAYSLNVVLNFAPLSIYDTPAVRTSTSSNSSILADLSRPRRASQLPAHQSQHLHGAVKPGYTGRGN
ncbi:hypothetical protein B0H11DRAFT_2261003 [Mycena galericulata]|nr:hypothetical protein B0H11DRAFT_2261003 [Mycena galericulata]